MMLLRAESSRLALAVMLAATFFPSDLASAADPVLARVEVSGDLRAFPLPAHGLFQDALGQDYLLVFALTKDLESAGWKWRTLAVSAVVDDFKVATPLRPGAANSTRGAITPVLDDGRRWIVRATPEETAALSEAGFAIQGIQPEPLDLRFKPPPPLEESGGQNNLRKSLPDPLVSAMIAKVESTNLWWLLRRLTGEETVMAGNEPSLITSRVTSSSSPLRKALAFAFDRLQSMDLATSYQSWVSGSVSNRNIIATLPGTTRANEFVLVTAHLDNMPASGLAPGADDNASGVAAVLTAAGIFSQHRFERTLRFILFTGEEQGLYGSTACAAIARGAGDNIVAVLNLDMLGYDSVAPANLELHTRTRSHTMYSNDLAILSVFTNAVATYGLSSDIIPVHRASGINASDHYPFWTRNYAAVLAIEDTTLDFTPWYHTSNDKITTLNFKYLTAGVKASVAAAAHLAVPAGRVRSDVLQVAASNWRHTAPAGSRVVLLKHAPAAAESGLDAWDLVLTNAAAITNTVIFGAFSSSAGFDLVHDVRPDTNQGPFHISLTASELNSGFLSGSNQLHIEFVAPAEPERVYNARIRIDPAFAANQLPFECVTNLVELARRGNRLQLPVLTNVPPGQAYGTCEIDCRFVDRSRESCRVEVVQLASSSINLTSDAQVGCRLLDAIEWSPSLASNSWQVVAAFTNDIAPGAASFDAGWRRIEYQVDTSQLPARPSRFFRLSRQWLAP